MASGLSMAWRTVAILLPLDVTTGQFVYYMNAFAALLLHSEIRDQSRTSHSVREILDTNLPSSTYGERGRNGVSHLGGATQVTFGPVIELRAPDSIIRSCSEFSVLRSTWLNGEIGLVIRDKAF